MDNGLGSQLNCARWQLLRVGYPAMYVPSGQIHAADDDLNWSFQPGYCQTIKSKPRFSLPNRTDFPLQWEACHMIAIRKVYWQLISD